MNRDDPFPSILANLAEAVEEGSVSHDLAEAWLKRFAANGRDPAAEAASAGPGAADGEGSAARTRIFPYEAWARGRTEVLPKSPSTAPDGAAPTDGGNGSGTGGSTTGRGSFGPSAGPQVQVSLRSDLDRYELLDEIGRGGLGRVYAAWDRRMNRQVAIKEMLPSALAFPALIGRFCLEAQITGRLEHPGVVPVYDFGIRDGGEPYYVMKLVRGTTLAERITRYHELAWHSTERALVRLELLGMFLDVCDATAYAHACGVLHRDLKPKNILVGDFGEVVLIDWGLARLATPDRSDAATAGGPPGEERKQKPPRTSWVLGSPVYMSPEQARGDPAAMDARSEVYTLGVILYELLAGRPPVVGGSAASVMARIQEGNIEPARLVMSDVPAPLDSVCLKALQQLPEDRFPDVTAMSAEIRRWLAGEAVRCHRENPLDLAVRLYRRHRGLCNTVAATLTVAIVGVSAWRWTEGVRTDALLERFERQTDTASAAMGVRDWNKAAEALAAAAALARGESTLQPELPVLAARSAAVDGARAWLTKRAEIDRLRDEAVFRSLWAETAAGRADGKRQEATCAAALALFPPAAFPPAEIAVGQDAVRRRNELLTVQQETALMQIRAVLRDLPPPNAAGPLPPALRTRLEKAAEDTAEVAECTPHDPALLTLRADALAALGDESQAAELRKLAAAAPRGGPADAFRQGEAAFEGANFAAAETHFRRVLELEPQHFWALYFLAAVAFRDGRLDLAEGCLTSVQSRRPEFFGGPLLLGLVHGWGGRLPEAEESFAAATRLGADPYHVAVNRGVVRMLRGNLVGAEQDLERAVELDPAGVEALANLAELGRRRQDGALLRRTSERAAAVAPHAPETYRIRAVEAHFRGDFDAAAGWWERLESAAVARPGVRHAALFHRALLEGSRGRIDEALAILEPWRLEGSDDLRLDWLLGMLAARDPQRADAALAALDRFIGRVRPRLGLGGAAPSTAGWDEFVGNLVPGMTSALAAAQRERAWLRLKGGDPAGALSDLDELLPLSSEQPVEGMTPETSAFLRGRRGWTFLLEGSRMAEIDFQAVLERNPTAADALSGRALSRALQGNWRGAQLDAEAAVRARPERREVLWNAATALVQAAVRMPPQGDAKSHRILTEALLARALERLGESVERTPAADRPAWVRKLAADTMLAPLFARDDLPPWTAPAFEPPPAQAP